MVRGDDSVVVPRGRWWAVASRGALIGEEVLYPLAGAEFMVDPRVDERYMDES